MSKGWLGSAEEVQSVLEKVHAEKTVDGAYVCMGGQPISFLGAGEEYVVEENVRVRVAGVWTSLVSLMKKHAGGGLHGITIF